MIASAATLTTLAAEYRDTRAFRDAIAAEMLAAVGVMPTDDVEALADRVDDLDADLAAIARQIRATRHAVRAVAP